MTRPPPRPAKYRNGRNLMKRGRQQHRSDRNWAQRQSGQNPAPSRLPGQGRHQLHHPPLGLRWQYQPFGIGRRPVRMSSTFGRKALGRYRILSPIGSIAAITGRLLALLIAGTLVSPAFATDNSPNVSVQDLHNACIASGNLCIATCREQYRGRKGFSASLGFDLCKGGCQRDYDACRATIAARAQTGAQTNAGGGSVLDSGPRPQKRSPVGAPASGDVAQ